MASIVNKYSMKDIIKQVGLLLSKTDLNDSFKSATFDSSLAEQFFEELYPISKFEKKEIHLEGMIKFDLDSDKIISVFEKYEELFDKEAYVFRTFYNMKHSEMCMDLEGNYFNKRPEKDDRFMLCLVQPSKISYDKAEKNARKLLRDADQVAIEDIRLDKKTGKAQIVTYQDYVKNTKSKEEKWKKAEKKFKQIEDTLSIDEVVSQISVDEFLEFCRYKKLGLFLCLDISKKQEEIKQQEGESQEDFLKRKSALTAQYVAHYIRQNPQYMDYDKLLVLSGINKCFLIANKEEDLNLEDIQALRAYCDQIEKLMDDKNAKVYSYKLSREFGFEEVPETVQYLESLFVEDRFVTPEEKKKLTLEVLDGKRPADSIPVNWYLEEDFLSKEARIYAASNHLTELPFFLDNGIIRRKRVFTSNAFSRFYNR